ncbi:hypothetical protein ACH5RR_002923 [Cinchona calisaya]|uniref:Uncharacterized protein n=1 Tax=Cinchona calisaya TaxID=153742 RepID=A0ABD3AU05_9GENT
MKQLLNACWLNVSEALFQGVYCRLLPNIICRDHTSSAPLHTAVLYSRLEPVTSGLLFPQWGRLSPIELVRGVSFRRTKGLVPRVRAWSKALQSEVGLSWQGGMA